MYIHCTVCPNKLDSISQLELPDLKNIFMTYVFSLLKNFIISMVII